MRVIAIRTLRQFWEVHADAEQPLRAWYQDAKAAEWSTPQHIKVAYANASIINGERVVFNIKGNDYRLLVSVNFRQKAAYVIWFGTHKEYDKINTVTIEFNTSILEYKTK